MSNNQYTIDEGIAWPLTATNLQRALEQRHKRAGDLKPNQHVFTVDDLAIVAKAYARHASLEIRKSPSKNPENQKRILKRLFDKLLHPAIVEYKKLNKTR